MRRFLRRNRECTLKPAGPDAFQRGGYPREGVGAKKFGVSIEIYIKHFFGGNLAGLTRVPEKLEETKFMFNSWPLASGVSMGLFDVE